MLEDWKKWNMAAVKSLIVNLAVCAVWYALEWQQFGELQWDRKGDNAVGFLYYLILWWMFYKQN